MPLCFAPSRECVMCAVLRSRLPPAKHPAMQKSLIHRHFCDAGKFSRKLMRRQNFFARRRASARTTRCTRRRRAAAKHKIKTVHYYFFPAVVIRWQCSSIRDCTYLCRHPLRLGGQQWRRRERKQRRRRRRQNVGRRSSLRRIRSSASHALKIASHEPAAFEGWSTISL
jgi:hypothetical protein